MSLVDTAFRLRIKRRGTLIAEQAQILHHRYSRVFWMAHSAWALLTGVAVLVLAHNRYGFLPWVVLFLALTWASTLVISRFSEFFSTPRLRFAKGFVSYLTRVMYQETLFFLIPFYFFSTTFPSWNCAYVIMLAALAVLSCYDLLFDRLLREHKVFALGFFGVVTFSALQFFLPLLLRGWLHLGAYLAAILAFLAALPLAYTSTQLRVPRRLGRIGLALLLVLAAVGLGRPTVPPVPLRLMKVRFSTQLEPRSLRTGNEYSDTMPLSALATGRLYAVATIFAPSRLATAVTLRFRHNGAYVDASRRPVSVVAHERGFRVWGTTRTQCGRAAAGIYTFEVWTASGQLVGRESVRVNPD